MRAGITAFSCGAILLYWVGVIPPLKWLLSTLGIAAIVICFTASPGVRRCLGILACGLAGLVWAGWWASERLSEALPASLEGERLTVTGYLCDIPSPGMFDSVRFSFCVDQWDVGGGLGEAGAAALPERLRLAWYGEGAQLDLPHTVRLTVVLKRPHGSVNPAGFRYETWLFRHGFRATGTVREVVADPTANCGLHCSYHRLRNSLASSLHDKLSSSTYYPLAEALLVGYRGWLTPTDWRTLQATGTIHLVAISGLHLGLVALGLGLVVRALLMVMPPRWLSPGRRRWVIAAIVIAGSVGYALLAGFTVPTRRALLMVTVACLLLAGARQFSAWSGWLLALFLVLLVDPFSPLDRGFWLSFGAVAVLILVFARRLRPAGGLVALVLAQLAVFAGLWPVLAVIDQTPAPLGALANLLAIPWVALVVMPVLMAGWMVMVLVPLASGVIGGVFDLVLGALWCLLAGLAEHAVAAPTIPVPVVIAVAALVLVLILVPAAGARYGAGVLIGAWIAGGLATMGSHPVANSPVSEPEVWVWDVGQGLSVLVRHRDQVLLYDTGPATPSGYSAVESVLLPNLARLGVRRIDWLVISHGDADHAGGLPLLFQELAVGRVITGEPARIGAQLDGVRAPAVEHCEAGARWRLGDLSVTLWRDGDAGGGRGDSNDASCVLVVQYGDVELILPGDITRRTEQRLLADLEWWQAGVRAVIAPHHGSNTSSGERWVATLAPDYVIYSAGYRHRFGHPHPLVMARYESIGAEAFTTAYTGAIRLQFSATDLHLQFSRDHAPFWIQAVGRKLLPR